MIFDQCETSVAGSPRKGGLVPPRPARVKYKMYRHSPQYMWPGCTKFDQMPDTDTESEKAATVQRGDALARFCRSSAADHMGWL
jgi:hypothetical protein